MPIDLSTPHWYVDHGDGILVPEYPSFEAALDAAARDSVSDPQDIDIKYGSELSGFHIVAIVQPGNHAIVEAEDVDIDLVLTVVDKTMVPGELVEVATSDQPIVMIEYGRPSGGVRSSAWTYVQIDDLEQNPVRSRDVITRTLDRMRELGGTVYSWKFDYYDAPPGEGGKRVTGLYSPAMRKLVAAGELVGTSIGEYRGSGVGKITVANPAGLTAKGNRLYQHVLKSIQLKHQADRRDEKRAATRAVVGAARRGVAGLVRKNPPAVRRGQKVVARIEKDVQQPVFAGGFVHTPDQLVRETLVPYMGDRATEMFLIIFLNIRNRVVGFNEYNSGSTVGVEVHASGIMRDALLSGAAAIVTVHQHPSGDPTPSADDRALWRRLKEAGEVVGIVVLDNLIVTADSGRYFSEREEADR